MLEQMVSRNVGGRVRSDAEKDPMIKCSCDQVRGWCNTLSNRINTPCRLKQKQTSNQKVVGLSASFSVRWWFLLNLGNSWNCNLLLVVCLVQFLLA